MACGIALSAFGVAAMPAACLYPEFAFDEPSVTGGGGGGGGGDASSTSGGGSNPVTTSSSSVSGGGGMGSGGMGGGGGASSSASSSSSGGGGMPGGEDCLNGLDDNADGLIDCADPNCQPVASCVPSVPFGWSGFAALFEGVQAQEPACPAVFPSPNPYVGHHTPIGGSASCSACSCDPAAGQTCSPPLEITVQNKPCGNVPNFTGKVSMPAGWNGSCYGPNGFPAGDVQCNGACNVSVTSAPPTVSGGACAPSGGQATVPPLSWAILGKACGDSAFGGGCGAGNVCQPKPPLPFISGICIYKSGDHQCQGPTYTQKHVFYGDAMDTRGCTGCQCGAVSGGSCTIEMSVYSDTTQNTCTTLAATFNAGGCGNLNGNPAVYSRKATVTQPPTGGTCPASGGQPTGSIMPSDPTTFCCIP
jgi:hypothetical protein